MKRSQIAAQLYTVRDHCKTAPELAASARRIKAIGYGAVQVSGVGPIPEDEIVRIMRGEGLVICATHEPGAAILDDTQQVIDRLGKLGCSYTAYPWPHVDIGSLEGALKLAAGLERAGERMARAKQVLTYHNHAIEFKKVGTEASATTVLELLYARTSPAHLQGEIDTYWIQAGGGDPAAWCRRLQDRLPLLHLKDLGVREGNQATTMEVGSGNLDWKAIVAAADSAGCRWFIVEQDSCPGDPFESLAISYRYLTTAIARALTPEETRMYYTGFADEASHGLAGQIAATRELGWSRIESRKIDGVNIHDLSEAAFDSARGQLQDAGISINCFGSAIANWGKSIEASDAPSQEEARRAIPRMRALGTRLVRVMSYALIPGKDAEAQLPEERFRRLRELVKLFADQGMQVLHENCNNYGGMGARYTLRMLEAVPGLRLVFDTGNPVQDDDHEQPRRADGTLPKQSSWDFYRQVKAHIAYVHIKDAVWDAHGRHARHTFPGEGAGDVRRIVGDLLADGYDGGFSIEPHLAVVHHDPSVTAPERIMHENYVEYGRRFMRLFEGVQAERTAQRRQGASR